MDVDIVESDNGVIEEDIFLLAWHRKSFFSSLLRQTTGMVASLLQIANLEWAVPDYSTLSRRQKTPAVQIPYRRADGPPNLLVDIEPVSATGSSEPARGNKVEGEGEWNARKHGGTKRRVRGKIHIRCPAREWNIRRDGELTRKRWKSGWPSSRPATWATRPCCQNCSTRPRPIRRSPASLPPLNEALQASRRFGRTTWRR